MKHEPILRLMLMLRRLQTMEPAIRISVRLSEIISHSYALAHSPSLAVPLNSLLIY